MYMQSFIKIDGGVLEKNCNKTMILCNFDKDSTNLRFEIMTLDSVDWSSTICQMLYSYTKKQ